MGGCRYGTACIFLFAELALFLPEFARAQSPAFPPAPRPVLLEGQKADRLALDQPKPEYPSVASINYIQGHVKMEILVGRDGKVSHAHVDEGNPILAVSALKAVQSWHYRPLETPAGPSSFITVVDMNFVCSRKAADPRPNEAERDLSRQIKPPEVVGRAEDSLPNDSVRMRLLLSDHGELIDSWQLPGAGGDLKIAKETVRGWTFRPARWGNMPIPSYLDVIVPVDNALRLAARQANGEGPK